jgi:protein-disulfide isomerase
MMISLSACNDEQSKNEITNVPPVEETVQTPEISSGKVSVAGLWSEEDPFVGDESAPISLVVYSDFQCPYCAEFFESLEKLENDWVKTGKLKIQYRDFPLNMHFNSVPAHMAANAAAKQGKYMEMHRMLFEKQKEWESANNPQKFFRDYATELGIELDQFERDSKDEALLSEIQGDKEDGRIAGVTGTPGFFMNGLSYDGALNYEYLVKALELTELSL